MYVLECMRDGSLTDLFYVSVFSAANAVAFFFIFSLSAVAFASAYHGGAVAVVYMVLCAHVYKFLINFSFSSFIVILGAQFTSSQRIRSAVVIVVVVVCLPFPSIFSGPPEHICFLFFCLTQPELKPQFFLSNSNTERCVSCFCCFVCIYFVALSFLSSRMFVVPFAPVSGRRNCVVAIFQWVSIVRNICNT